MSTNDPGTTKPDPTRRAGPSDTEPRHRFIPRRCSSVSPSMSTNDPGTTNPDSTRQVGPDTEPASTGPSQKADIEPRTPTRAKDVRQVGPDTGQRTSAFATKLFRTAGLDQARQILLDEVTYLINISTDHLWDAYPLGDGVLKGVKAHLAKEHFLTKTGKWSRTKVKEEFFRTRETGGSEVKTFRFFSNLFNQVLAYLKKTKRETAVKTMVHAGYVGPESTRVSTHRPDAFLQMAGGTSPTPGKFRWRDLACPFEYKFGDGIAVDVSQPGLVACHDRDLIIPQNDAKAFWSLLHIMRCDPRRMFSFGSTIHGTKFRIWLLCRSAPFTFTPFDWFEVGVALVLRVPGYLISSRILIHSSNSSSCSLPPLRRTSVSTRTSIALVRRILTLALPLKGGIITRQSCSTILALMHRVAGGHGRSRWWTKRQGRYASSRIAGSRIFLGKKWSTTS